MTINRKVVYSLTRCHTFRPPPSPLLLRPFQYVFPGGVASGGGARGQGLVAATGKRVSLPGLQGSVRDVGILPDL